MTRQKGSANGNGRRVRQTLDDPQHFHFGLSTEAIAAFDFNRSGALGNGSFKSCVGIFKQRLFAHGLQRLSGIQDSAAFLCNFLVTLPLNAAQKLFRPIRGIN